MSAPQAAGLRAERLAIGSRWAGFVVDIGFWLGRWSSHIREHTVQVEKAMVMLGHTPSEVDPLIRLILAEWDRAEAVVYGFAGGETGTGGADRSSQSCPHHRRRARRPRRLTV